MPINRTTEAVASAQATYHVVAIEGGIWACAPVSERPEVVLTNWHVFEVKLPANAKRTRHFAGENITDHDGRTSSAIVTFDAANGCGITQSGRVYHLRGSSGLTGDGEYTWRRWKSINAVVDVLDVTAEIKSMMKRK